MADLGSLLGSVGGGGIGKATVQLQLDSASYDKQLNEAKAQTTTSANQMGTGFDKFKGIAMAGMAVAGAAIVKFGVDSINAFKESEAAMAQTNAVLKSTGGAANVTAQDVLALAQKLRDLSGADDEAIQASENLLLTFTKVRNEAGQGNDVFNQTEAAILDMATSMNNGAIPSMEDLNSKTILVGKAMNDPIKGLTALTRVGVSFTEGQKEQITAMVEAGDTMGAQKLILAELTKEFGGSAKAAGDTFAGAQAKAAQKIEDLEEVIGGLLLPVITDLSAKFADLVTDLAPVIEFVGRGLVVAFDAASDEIERIIGPIQELIDLLPSLSDDVGDSSGIWKLWGDAVGGAIQKLIEQEVPGSQAYFAFRDAGDQATEMLQTQHGVIGDLSAFYRGRFAESMDTAVESQTINENAARHLTEAMRDQRLAVLALSNSFLGIIDSANQVSDAQGELNRLEQHGKEETKAYEQAVLDALEAQVGLEDAVLSYAKELADSGETQRAVKDKVRELGAQFGIQKDIIRDLIQEVVGYISQLNNIPSRVTTTLGINTPSEVRGFQHGGIITRPTLALIGEAGPEAVIPLSRGGLPVNVTVNVAGSVIAEKDLAETIRRELIRTGSRNPSIFGGRA